MRGISNPAGRHLPKHQTRQARHLCLYPVEVLPDIQDTSGTSGSSSSGNRWTSAEADQQTAVVEASSAADEPRGPAGSGLEPTLCEEEDEVVEDTCRAAAGLGLHHKLHCRFQRDLSITEHYQRCSVKLDQSLLPHSPAPAGSEGAYTQVATR